MPKIVNKRIIEVCDIANSDKTITREKAKANEGVFPVYAATIGEPFAYIDFYNNEKPALIVVNDGASGSTYIVNDDKYTIGKHVTGLIPHEGIDIQYLQLVSEPVFKRIAKGYGLGNLPQADVKSAVISIPIRDDGTYDTEEQKVLSDIYSEIARQKENLQKRIFEINELLIHIGKESEIKYIDIPLNDMVTHHNGDAAYTKTWCQNHKGVYPLYSANNYEPISYIDHFDYDGEYLTYSKNGCAGFITIINGKFSINGDRCVMTINPGFEDISLDYLKYYLEPVFRANKKGRLGAFGKNEFTKLNSTMIRGLNIQIPIPLTIKGTFDLDKQNEIADKYTQIDEIKQGLIEGIQRLISINVVPGVAD